MDLKGGNTRMDLRGATCRTLRALSGPYGAYKAIIGPLRAISGPRDPKDPYESNWIPKEARIPVNPIGSKQTKKNKITMRHC